MSTPRVAILTIGSELLAGDGLDTNSQWLSRRLVRLGLAPSLHASCPDDIRAMVEMLRFASERAEVVISTGGLGPTSDDLTREAFAELMGAELELHEPSLEHIRALFARFQRTMPDTNQRQARLPVGARVLTNKVGTAPAFAVEQAGTRLYALPGVPREVYWLWDHYLHGELRELAEGAGARVLAERTFRTVGISESKLGELLSPLNAEPELELRYAAEERKGTIRVTLLTPGEERAQAQWERARELAGTYVVAFGNDLLPEMLAATLTARGLSLATAESCTGGRVAAALTGVAGASRVFSEGLVTYSNDAKVRLLGVPAEVLAEHGAVSPQTAEAMARGVRERAGSDLGLGITGIAGPGGGSPEKPVGLVHLAVAGPGDAFIHQERRYPGDRALIQTRSAAGAMALVLRALAEDRPRRP